MNRRNFLKIVVSVVAAAAAPIAAAHDGTPPPAQLSLDSVNRKRLALTLNQEIESAYMYVMDLTATDLNDATTRSIFQKALSDVFTRYADMKLIKDFSVTCDETNNTEQALMSGIVSVDAWYQFPSEPNSIVRLSFHHT